MRGQPPIMVLVLMLVGILHACLSGVAAYILRNVYLHQTDGIWWALGFTAVGSVLTTYAISGAYAEHDHKQQKRAAKSKPTATIHQFPRRAP